MEQPVRGVGLCNPSQRFIIKVLLNSGLVPSCPDLTVNVPYTCLGSEQVDRHVTGDVTEVFTVRQGFRGTRGRTAMRLVGLVSVAALAAACSGGGGGGGGGGGEDKKEPVAPVVAITPADGTGKAAPEKGVVVKATLGKLTAVKVTLKGKDVPGALSADQKSWKSSWTLTPNSSYTCLLYTSDAADE